MEWNASSKALLEVDVDVFDMADADMAYCANQVHQVVQPELDGKTNMVVGDRHTSGDYFSENKRSFHNLVN